MKQLIYRRDHDARVDVVGGDVNFRFCSKPTEIISLKLSMVSCFGGCGYWKAYLKLWRGRRAFYCLIQDTRLVHYGWVAYGFCKYYPIKPDDIVIGPIWTDPDSRGLGLGTRALQCTVNALLERGARVLYIDTSEDNIPCQRVIAKGGFVQVGVYRRSPERLRWNAWRVHY